MSRVLKTAKSVAPIAVAVSGVTELAVFKTLSYDRLVFVVENADNAFDEFIIELKAHADQAAFQPFANAGADFTAPGSLLSMQVVI